MSKNLLKEAIADAKAVRETAIANAKLALEEAFTPRLQSMLSQKIAEESDDFGDDEEELADTPEATVEMDADDSTDLGQEDETEEAYNEVGEDESEGGEETDDDIHETEDEDVYETEDEPDAELESIIKELEDEAEGEDEVTTDEDHDDEEVPVTEDEETEAEPAEETEDDEIDLEEVIKALQEEDEDEVTTDEETEEDLKEAYKTIKFLKDKINEVNLLNAKLLFSNKLFRSNGLNESQKMKIIETFDRATSVREVKLVYTTLAESLTGYKPTKRRTVTEGFASKAVNSTKPNKNVIVESNNFSSRMKKLAGLL
tara:strand:- start:7587 stop:8531 length:945 start_codon:yes stop_codon:yes gene_type:complete